MVLFSCSKLQMTFVVLGVNHKNFMSFRNGIFYLRIYFCFPEKKTLFSKKILLFKVLAKAME